MYHEMDKLGIFRVNQTSMCLHPHQNSSFFICVCLCHMVLARSFSIVVTCRECADLLAFMYVTFCCVFDTFPYVDLGHVWYLTVHIDS